MSVQNESAYKISASLMCADLGNLREELKKLEQAGIDWLHIDIMDGHFVPNLTFGPDFVRRVRQTTNLPLDIHLMVEHPGRYIDVWQAAANDVISFHIEATKHPQRVLEQIKSKGAKAAIALNPATMLGSVEYILDELDMLVVMTVNPGFAGQKWIPSTKEKVGRLKEVIKKRGLRLDIQVDGNIGEHNIALLRRAGADVFVGGSSSVFADPNYSENISRMRKLIVQDKN